jgi:hypothetical protein
MNGKNIFGDSPTELGEAGVALRANRSTGVSAVERGVFAKGVPCLLGSKRVAEDGVSALDPLDSGIGVELPKVFKKPDTAENIGPHILNIKYYTIFL